MNYFARNTELTVKIVSGELRAVGHYKVYSYDHAPSIQGYFWRNEAKGFDARHYEFSLENGMNELFKILIDIQKQDREFFELVMSKLSFYPNQSKGLSVSVFDYEVKHMNEILNHTPHRQKMVVWNTDDYGRTQGSPIGTVEIVTSGDSKEDSMRAVEILIGKRCGFYTGRPLTGELRQELAQEIDELQRQIDALNNVLY